MGEVLQETPEPLGIRYILPECALFPQGFTNALSHDFSLVDAPAQLVIPRTGTSRKRK
jgi:hypothetical protein